MAFTLPVRLAARIVDGLGIEAGTYAYALIDPTASWTDVLAFLSSWLTALDACTDGQVTQGTITALPALPGGLKSAPLSTSRVEQTGVLNFLADGSTYRWAATVPALSDGGTVTSGGKVVLTGGGPASNLIGVLLGGSALLEWTNSNQQLLTSFKDALISFRQYNRQLSVATYETA